MSCAYEYAPALRARGYRMTPQRLAILHVLRHAGTHLSPSEVYRQAKKELPGLTEPTVYRTLEFLAGNGMARATHAGNSHLLYEIAGADHHHVVCRLCGKALEVEHSLLETLYNTLESTTGYLRIDRHMTFVGTCPGCQR